MIYGFFAFFGFVTWPLVRGALSKGGDTGPKIGVIVIFAGPFWAGLLLMFLGEPDGGFEMAGGYALGALISNVVFHKVFTED